MGASGTSPARISRTATRPSARRAIAASSGVREFLFNREDQPVGGFPEEPTDTPLVFKYRDAVGLYSYVEARLTRRFHLGFLFDYVQDVAGLEPSTRAYSPYFTVWASEFQRLRLQYTYLDEPGDHENQFFVQWTAVLGSHVHGFRDR